MLSGTVVKPGEFVFETRPAPTGVPESWVLIGIEAVGICGTDYHILEGKHPYLKYPRVIGHELSARVCEDGSGWRAGDLVVVNPYISCGECRSCRRGKPNCCSNIEVLGVHRDGGLCARLAVPAANLYAADGLSPLQAAMVEFLAIGAHAVRRSGVQKGDRTLVTGAGPIGLGTALFARLAGADVHLLDLSTARLEQAQRLFGFSKTHKVGSKILADDLVDGFDVVFDATGNAKAIEAGFQFLAHGSSYVLVSVVKDDISFNDAEFHKREARIIGSRNATAEDFQHVMTAIRDGQIDTGALCSQTIPLEDFAQHFPGLAQDRETLIKAIVTLE
ncbi:zinc-binding alcohol dehydrogenase family protein [Roseibium sp.]